MMPPNGAAARADHSATLEVIAHNKLIDPEIGRLLDALEPWADGEDPDSDDVRLLAAVRRDHEKAVRVPDRARRRDQPRRRARPAGLAGGARGLATSASSATRSSATSSSATATSPASTPAEHPYDLLLDDFEPGLTTAELRPLFAQLRDALVDARRQAAGDGDAGAQRRRLLRPVRGRRPAPRGDGGARGGRLRRRRLAARPGAAPVRAVARPDRRPHHHPLRPARLRRRALLRPARVRPRPLRGGHRARARAQPARPAGLARHPRVPEPAVGERRRPLAPVLRLGAADAARGARPRDPGGRRRRRASTARSTPSSAR